MPDKKNAPAEVQLDEGQTIHPNHQEGEEPMTTILAPHDTNTNPIPDMSGYHMVPRLIAANAPVSEWVQHDDEFFRPVVELVAIPADETIVVRQLARGDEYVATMATSWLEAREGDLPASSWTLGRTEGGIECFRQTIHEARSAEVCERPGCVALGDWVDPLDHGCEAAPTPAMQFADVTVDYNTIDEGWVVSTPYHDNLGGQGARRVAWGLLEAADIAAALNADLREQGA